MRTRFTLIITLAAFGQLHAQQSDLKWSGSMLSDRAFLENKGQFDGRTGPNDEAVLYAVDEGALQILFTKSGVTYRFDEKEKNYYRQRGDRNKPRMITTSELVHMRWEGAAANVKVVAEGLRKDPHTYSSLLPDNSVSDITGVRGYASITYKGLYPGIDVRYTIHPVEGIKYDVLLAAGADPAQVRMSYAQDRRMHVDGEGRLHIATRFGDILEHAPVAYYKGKGAERIPARFKVDGRTVSFVLDGYDTRRAIVIDPWVVSPSFSNSNKIWDIEVDASNNVYVYGGDTPLRLRKYDPAGVLQWTYNTPWDTANYWIGSLITDPDGNSYITAGTDPRIAKVNSNGVLQWSANGGAFDEYWRMSFNCDYTEMVLGGTRLVLGPTLFPIGYGRAFRMNLTNGSVINSVNVAATSPSLLINNPNEIRALCASPNGRYYFMTLDTIGCITEDLNLIYRRNNSYAFSYQVAGYGVTNMGINGMAATADHIYTMNGATLHKRSINTGAIVATATIPSGTTTTQLGANSAQNGGVALDSCGNVLVGAGNGVYRFDADLNLLGSASTPGRVYDVAVDQSGEVVACGQGFVAKVNLTTCAPPPIVCCYSSINAVAPLCVNGPAINLSSETSGGTWSGPGIVDPATGLFDPAVAGIGSHEITYTLACGSSTTTVLVSPCAPLSVCFDPATGTYNASNGVGPYVWEQQTTTQDCSACFLLCLIPPGCAVNVLTWSPLATGPSIPAPSNFPIRVTDAAGTVLIIDNAAQVPECVPCPTITVSNTGQTDVLCFGQSTGEASVSTSGGSGNYLYTWAPGGLVGAEQSGLAAGTYTVTATDEEGCNGTLSVVIQEPQAPLQVDVISITGASCAGGDGTATITVSGGTGASTITWSPAGGNGTTASDLDQGTYTVDAVDANGCTATINVIIPSLEGPQIISVNSTASACAPPSGTISVVASGDGLEYSLDGISFQSSNTFTGIASGTYTVVVRDADGCTTTASVTVDGPLPPAPVITGPTSGCAGEELILATTQPFVSYAWSTGSSAPTTTVTTAGSYTVSVTDANGCIGTSAPFSVTFESPQAAFTTDPVSPQLPGTTVDFFDASTSGGGSIVSWQWDFGNGTGSGTTPSWTYTDAGQYPVTLIVTTANGCTDTLTLFYVIRPADIVIPNVFSPNGDGQNDFFAIENIEFFGNELAIFNRWGNQIFAAKDYRNTWRGVDQPDGTYYFILILEDGREFKGHVTLLR